MRSPPLVALAHGRHRRRRRTRIERIPGARRGRTNQQRAEAAAPDSANRPAIRIRTTQRRLQTTNHRWPRARQPRRNQRSRAARRSQLSSRSRSARRCSRCGSSTHPAAAVAAAAAVTTRPTAVRDPARRQHRHRLMEGQRTTTQGKAVDSHRYLRTDQALGRRDRSSHVLRTRRSGIRKPGYLRSLTRPEARHLLGGIWCTSP